MRIWTGFQVLEIDGDNVVTGIKVQRDEEEVLLLVRDVFIEIGSIPNSDLVDFVGKNVWGEIIVNCKCETNVPRLFAAGDVADVPAKQIIIAGGEGCKATLTAFRYLSQR